MLLAENLKHPVKKIILELTGVLIGLHSHLQLSKFLKNVTHEQHYLLSFEIVYLPLHVFCNVFKCIHLLQNKIYLQQTMKFHPLERNNMLCLY